MKALKQSETKVIKRSQIALNPINPKRHSDDKVKLQKKNLTKVGFCGGIVWNEQSGNLVDGHRRIKAMDLYYNYDGSNDYDVKVEAVSFDDKTEKEQLTYMAVGNTKADIDLIGQYIHEIDYSDVGLSENDINSILAMTSDSVTIDTIDDFMDYDDEPTPQPSYEDKKSHMKDVKAQVRDQAEMRARNENAYITLSFSSFGAKEAFCDMVGCNTDDNFIKGELVLNHLS